MKTEKKSVDKKYTHPVRIQLSEIPDEGRQFQYNRDSGELNHLLEDIIGKNTYSVDLRLQPSGNVYSISGDIRTQLETQCSHCGRDMEYPVNDSFNELIVIEDPRPRKSDSSHSMSEDSSIYCNHIQSQNFNIGEFVHEHIAASEPFVVKCERADCDSFFEKAQKSASAPENMGKQNPFEALKNFKPKH